MNINSDKEQRLSESFDEYTYMLEECIDESLKELEEYKREMKEKRKHVLFRLKQVRDKQKQLESLALKIQKGLGEVV